jgi:hypothetical protein
VSVVVSRQGRRGGEKTGSVLEGSGDDSDSDSDSDSTQKDRQRRLVRLLRHAPTRSTSGVNMQRRALHTLLTCQALPTCMSAPADEGARWTFCQLACRRAISANTACTCASFLRRWDAALSTRRPPTPAASQQRLASSNQQGSGAHHSID